MMFENARIVKKQAKQEEYRKQDVERGDPLYRVSRSDLCAILACPHKWRYGSGEDSTKEIEWGTLMDAMLLGGELGISVTPETYEDDKGNKKPWNWNANVCKQWRDKQEGLIIVKPDTFAKAEYAVKRLRDDKVIASVLNADYQVWVEADYRYSDKSIIPVKGLIDIVPKNSFALADFKTTQTAEPRQYGRSIWSFGYHIQAALYLALWNAAAKESRNIFLHVIQESSEPYEVGRRMLDSNWIQIGREKYKAALKLYGQCLESNTWPAYDDMDAPGVERVEGWTLTSPETWMILNADVKMGNSIEDVG